MSSAFPGKDAGSLARARTRVLAGLSFCVVASGCLVTDKIEYIDQNLPPIIRVISPGVLQQFPASSQCPDNTTVGGDAAIDAVPRGDWVRFQVEVSDPNIEDRLVTWVVLNGRHFDGKTNKEIPTTGVPERDPVEFCIPAQALDTACNVVELIVMGKNDWRSSETATYGIDLELDKEKYARAWWFVLGRTNDNPGLCPLGEDAGVLP